MRCLIWAGDPATTIGDQSFTPSTIESLRDAERAAIMFNDKVRSDLDHAVHTANCLIVGQTRTSKPDPQAINALVENLQRLIRRMTGEL